jgi:hypothetical protein
MHAWRRNLIKTAFCYFLYSTRFISITDHLTVCYFCSFPNVPLFLRVITALQAGIASSGSHNKTGEGNYTGTLKAVIKLQRSSPEKRRTPLKLVLKNGKAHTNVDEASTEKGENEFENLVFDGHEKMEYTVCKEVSFAKYKNFILHALAGNEYL